MQFKIGDLVCFKGDNNTIWRIYEIKDYKCHCQLYYWLPQRICDVLAEEDNLRRATLEDWKDFCGKREDIFEKHKEDIINGNAPEYINGLFDYSKSDCKRYCSPYEEALNEENDARHRIAGLIHSMIDEYNKSKDYSIGEYLFNHFTSYESHIRDLKEENKKLKNLLINLSNEKNKYKEIAELFKESGIWDLKTNYDDCEYCLCDSSDGYRTYSLTVEQFYKLEDYLIDKKEEE